MGSSPACKLQLVVRTKQHIFHKMVLAFQANFTAFLNLRKINRLRKQERETERERER